MTSEALSHCCHPTYWAVSKQGHCLSYPHTDCHLKLELGAAAAAEVERKLSICLSMCSDGAEAAAAAEFEVERMATICVTELEWRLR